MVARTRLLKTAGILVMLLLIAFSGNVSAQGGDPITVDGLLDDSYSFLAHFDKSGVPPDELAPGNLYGYEGTQYCYWAFVVDRDFNDNVYADKGLDDPYMEQDGWQRRHSFDKLERSDGFKVDVTYTGGSYTGLWLDYLNKEKQGSEYLSGTASGEQDDSYGSGLMAPIDQAATSLYWNLENSNWNGGTWGDPLKHSPPYSYNETSGNYWEWQMIYEFRIAKSDMGGDCGTVTQAGAHNSPSKENETKGKIGDYVWNDANRNGLQDDGGASAGIFNVTVYLWDNNTNTIIRTTQTSPSGYYIFVNLDAGNYRVEFVLPTAYAFTGQNQGSDDTIDSDADTTTGKTGVITLASGETQLQWDAGLYWWMDFGDLPADYNNTTLADDGARHVIGTLSLGNVLSGDRDIDAESDGQVSDNADGDDAAGDNDEEGVVPISIGTWTEGTNGGTVRVAVNGGNGCLDAWINWNHDSGDRDFGDTGEQIFQNKPVSAGVTNYSFDIPTGALAGTPGTTKTFFARFRLSPTDGSGSCTATVGVTGEVTNGEVEDYKLTRLVPTAITLSSMTARSAPARFATAPVAALALLSATVVAGAFGVTRRRRT